MNKDFLPISKEDLAVRGWNEVDVALVTGDAYVDHPSYGASVIGRVLEDAGFKVGIIAQPDWRSTRDFLRLGRPRLFAGVSAGNLDSMVANLTANKKRRREDDYSPGGRAGLRPDRASIIYSNRLREAFPGIPIVLGGLEASLRRLAHYDYWSDKVRRSLLLDAKADILVYGMGEGQILEIARRLKERDKIEALQGIKGTVIARKTAGNLGDHVEVPSFEDVSSDKDKFNEAFRKAYLEFDPIRGRTVVQKHGDRFVIMYPPAAPSPRDFLDRIYLLNYMRRWHPVYDKDGGVPGLESVRFSIISHRGCPGECSFCGLYFHQGRIVQSRSPESILKEAKALASQEDFGGTITDIGGPTANLYMTECAAWRRSGACKDKKCLVPGRCKNLELGYCEILKLWEKARSIPKVKHVFTGSGVRYDLLVDKSSDEYLAALCKDHVSGQLKVAPEHSSEKVLRLMNKPSFEIYEKFVRRFNEFNKRLKKDQYLVNYFISSHPGAGLVEARDLAMKLKKAGIYPEQIQDFIPLPMTVSGCMYYTGKDPFTGREVYVARGLKERRMQRALIQYKNPRGRKDLRRALKCLNY